MYSTYVLGGGGERKYGWPAAEVKKFAPRSDSTGGEGGGVLTVNGELCPMGYHILSFTFHPTPNSFLSVQVYKICIHNFQEISKSIKNVL
jgi:hypothetical protein